MTPPVGSIRRFSSKKKGRCRVSLGWGRRSRRTACLVRSTLIAARLIFSRRKRTGGLGTEHPSSGAATGGYTPAPWAAGGGDWSGASAGTPTLNRVPGGTGGFNPLAMLFGGARGGAAGGSGPNGLAGIVSNLKRTNWGSVNRSPSNPTYGTEIGRAHV